MDSRMRRILTVGCALLVGGLLTVEAPAQHEGHHGRKETAAGKRTDEKPKCEMCAKMKQERAEIQKLLTEARAAAQEKGATAAAEKIARALDLMEQHHKAMREMMKKHMEKEASADKVRDGAKDEGGKGMKCPMCAKMKQKETSLPAAGAAPTLVPAGLILAAEETGEKIVNSRCPVMGNALPEHMPKRMTRKWNGLTVGFCCPGCITTWDRLTDQERQKKLEPVMR